MARVAVVGAGGFIGAHVARALDAAGHEVVRLHRDWLTEANGRGSLDRLEGGAPAAVVNCAGATRGTQSELQAANVDAVGRLLETLDGSGILFVHIGSAAEYGAGQPAVAITEEHPPQPLSTYGASKLDATIRVLDAAREGLVRGTVLRVFNPVGAGISEDLLPGRAAKLLRQALRDGGTVQLGPLGATRDYLDVRDVAASVAAALAAPDVSGTIVNIGSGEGTTARRLVELLAKVAGYDGPILEMEQGLPRADDVAWQVADITRARTLLGWRPRHTLLEAVTQLWSAAAPSATTSSKTAPS